MKQADQIRAFLAKRYIAPARAQGVLKVSIRAGDVHRELELKNAVPAVCSALGSNKFALECGVRAVGRSGPSNGSNAVFDFEVTHQEPSEAWQQPVAGAKPFPPTFKEVLAPQRQEPDALDLRGTLVLISCVKSKRPHPTEARDLYVSPLFTMARDLAEAQGAEYRILSARHGLVHPATEIEPYEYSLNHLGRADRLAWAQHVLAQLLPIAREKRRVVFFAGERYRHDLIGALRSNGVDVQIPMEGLRQGEQLSWLKVQL